MTVNELLDVFQRSYMENKLKPTTISGYTVNIRKHLLPYIGSLEVSALTYERMDELVRQLHGDGLHNTSVKYVFATLRKAYNFGIRRGYVTCNPVCSYDIPSADKYNYVTLSERELSLLLQDLQVSDNDLFAPVLLAGCFGMRRGECIGLKVSDIGLDVMHIRRTAVYMHAKTVLSDCKTDNSVRDILLNESFREALMTYDSQRAPNPDGYLVRRKDGQALSSNAINNRFRKVLHRLHLPDIRFHDLRHTYATMMLQNGVNPKIVSQVLGHSDVSVTLQIYSHADISMQARCLEVLRANMQKKALV